MTAEERKLAKERERARCRARARYHAMSPEKKAKLILRNKLRRDELGLVGLYADGKLSRCGFRWNARGGHGNARIDDRRREVYARMAKIENGWRK